MNLANTFYINRTKLAEELGVSVATLRNWAKAGNFPAPMTNSGKTPIYRTDEVTAWLEKDGGSNDAS